MEAAEATSLGRRPTSSPEAGLSIVGTSRAGSIGSGVPVSGVVGVSLPHPERMKTSRPGIKCV